MGKEIDIDLLRNILKNCNYYSQSYDKTAIQISIEKIKDSDKLKVSLVSFEKTIDITDKVNISLDTDRKEIDGIIKNAVDVNSLFTEEENKVYSYVDIVDLVKEFMSLIKEKNLDITQIAQDPKVIKLDPLFVENLRIMLLSLETDDIKILKSAKTPCVRYGLGKSLTYILKTYK